MRNVFILSILVVILKSHHYYSFASAYTSCTQASSSCEICTTACIGSAGCGVCFWCFGDNSCSSFNDLGCSQECTGKRPSEEPTNYPTSIPAVSIQPSTSSSTVSPSPVPRDQPTERPNFQSYEPTGSPTIPTNNTIAPSISMTVMPSTTPFGQPTESPYETTSSPTFRSKSSTSPSISMTAVPSAKPLAQPTRRPFFRPTEPTNYPTFRPKKTAQPSIPEAPTSDDVLSPTLTPTLKTAPLGSWYFDTASYNANSPTVTAWFIQISFYVFFTITEIVLNFRGATAKFITICQIAKEVVMLLIWSIFILCWLCARYSFFTSSEGQSYKPYTYNNNDGEQLTYVTSSWFSANDDNDQYDAIAHCSYDGPLHSASSTTCSFIIGLGADILTHAGAKAGVVLGLIIYIVMQSFLVYKRAQGRWITFVEGRDDQLTTIIFDAFLYFSFEWLVNFQQYLVMLPLNAISANEYCLHVNVPVSTKKAMCEFKIVAVAIPYGLIALIICAIMIFVTISICGASENKEKVDFLSVSSIIAMLEPESSMIKEFPVACCYFVWLLWTGCVFLWALAILGYYFFGGLVLGMWYQIGSAISGFGPSHMSLIMGLMKATASGFAILDFFLRKYVLKYIEPERPLMGIDADGVEVAEYVLCCCGTTGGANLH